MEEYDKGCLSYDSAHRIIKQCRNGVHYCDGNEYEALEAFEEQGRCTWCFEKKETILDIWDLPEGYPSFSWDTIHRIFKEDKLLGNYVCAECVGRLSEQEW